LGRLIRVAGEGVSEGTFRGLRRAPCKNPGIHFQTSHNIFR